MHVPRSPELPVPGRNRKARRRWWAAGISVVALLLASIAVLVRDDVDTSDTLHATRATLHLTSRQLAAATADLQRTVTELADRTGERDQLAAQFAAARTYAAGLQAELNRRSSEVSSQQGYIAAQAQCLEGVQRALNQIAVDDHAGAVASLQAVTVPCRTAARPPPATGPDAAPASAPPQPSSGYPFDFPDPFVLHAAGAYFAFATNSGLGTVQVIRSTDLITWRPVGNALTSLPPWAQPDETWGPSVLVVPGRGYVLYYTARVEATGTQCISRATAAVPQGPYADDSTAPLVCQTDRQGSIDPSPFVDPAGIPWLVWKSEGLAVDGSRIWAQPLTRDGLALTGMPSQLITADRPWEAGVVEGPALVTAGHTVYLLYAGGAWTSASYAIGYARCSWPGGPCAKGGIVLSSRAGEAGPGGPETFTTAAGQQMLAFHAYQAPAVGPPNSRLLHIAPLTFPSGVPTVGPG